MIDCDQLHGRRREICLGYDKNNEQLTMSERKRFEYLKMWLTEVSEEEIKDFLKAQKEDSGKLRGIGDIVAKAIKVVTFGKVTPCGGCRKRQEMLNKMFPFKE